MYRLIPVLVLCLLAGIRSAAAAESLAVYSNVCLNDESGDLNGVRIAILRLGDSPYFALQWAGGDTFEEPEMNKLSLDDLSKGKMNFFIQNGKNPARFSGTITEKAIVGTFDNKSLMKDFGGKVIQLRKVPLSQKSYQSCR